MMSLGPRNSRFHARIKIERSFLTPTNRVFGAKAELAGMTAKAITDWVARARVAFPGTDVVGIADLLTAASSRAEILADDSRDTFRPELARPTGLDELARLLDEKLRATGLAQLA